MKKKYDFHKVIQNANKALRKTEEISLEGGGPTIIVDENGRSYYLASIYLGCDDQILTEGNIIEEMIALGHDLIEHGNRAMKIVPKPKELIP